MIQFNTKNNENALIVDKSTKRLGIKTTTPRTVLDISTNDKIIIPRGTNSERSFTDTNNTEIYGAMRFNTDIDSFEVYSKEPDDSTGAGNYNWRSFSRLVNYDASSEIFLGNRYDNSYTQVAISQNTNITFKTNNINRMTIHRDGIVEVDDDCSGNYPVFSSDTDISYIYVKWDSSITNFTFSNSEDVLYNPLILQQTKTYVFYYSDDADTGNNFYIVDQRGLSTSLSERYINTIPNDDNYTNNGISEYEILTVTFDFSYGDHLTETDNGYDNQLYYYVGSTPMGTFDVSNDNITHIWVDGGFFGFPYYYFYEGTNDTPNLDKQYFNLTLDIQKVYRFHRINDVTTHPFYISDQETTSKITISGYGSDSAGITGEYYFDLKFNSISSSTNDIHSHKQFNITSHKLYYYCTSHSSMNNTFHLMNSRPYLKTSSTIGTTDSAIIINNTDVDNTLTGGPSILLSTDTLSSTETTSSFLTINNTLTLNDYANLKINEHAKFKSNTETTTIGTTDSTDCFDISGDTYVGGTTFEADCLDISGLGSTGIYIPTSVSNPSIGHLRLNSSDAFYGHNDTPINTSDSTVLDISDLIQSYDIYDNNDTFLEYYNGDVWQNVDQGISRGNTNDYNRPPYMVFSTSGMNLFGSSSLTRLPKPGVIDNYKLTTDHPYLFGYADVDSDSSGGILINQPGVYMGTFVAKTSNSTIFNFSLLKDTSTNSENKLNSPNDSTSTSYLYKDDSLTWTGDDVIYSSVELYYDTIFKNTFMFTLDEPSTLILKVSTSDTSALSKIQLRITAMSFWDPNEITEETIS